MPAKKDLTGKTIKNIKVLKNLGINKYHKSIFLCECYCGNEFVCVGSSLENGNTSSCGCYSKIKSKENGLNNKTHGLTNSRLYSIWNGLKERCYNKNCLKDYKNYGGRGITVCYEWLDKNNGFINFYNWSMANEYQKDLTIDRIDNNKGYSPDNCRWCTQKQQCRNRRNNHIIIYNNISKTMIEWAEYCNIDYYLFKSKIKHFSLKDIIENTCESKNIKYISYQGLRKSLKEWSNILNIPYNTLSTRLQRKWTVERAFNNINIT
jgi:hypothetical protein